MNCYINGLSSVSAQDTFEKGFNDNLTFNPFSNVLYAIEPNYKEFISRIEIRRMEKGVKMSIAAATQALLEAALDKPDAIITGTGMSCLRASEKFLKAMLANSEQYLTPINFIQSTHNTVAGQLALKLKCNGYNFNYVSSSVSFESALLDAHNQLTHQLNNHILVGAVDESNEHTINLYKHIDFIKKDDDAPYSILKAKSSGIVMSEGAHFYALGSKKSPSSYAKLIAVEIINHIDSKEIGQQLDSFLDKNNIVKNSIDIIVLGNNGDIQYDYYYHEIEKLFPTSEAVYYKHLSGEYPTASAFGFSLACSILKNKKIPKVVSTSSVKNRPVHRILLYNQYRGYDHSFTLLDRI